MRRFAIAAIVLTLALVGSCRWLLPERYAVNAPIGHMLFGRGGETPVRETVQSRLHAPDGHAVAVYVGGLQNPRWLRFTPTGDLLVSTPRSGKVMLVLRDADGDGRADGTRVLLEGLEKPHGLELHEGWLYVAEGSGIGRVEFDPAARATRGEYRRVVDGLPSGGNHWTRSVRIGPDGWMYVTVGSSCNVCEEQDRRRAAMLRYRPDGSGEEIVARGLRNSVGFDWQPGTGALYATDNGRDLLGDDFPPCELNRIEPGAFYGWPYANGDRVLDPDLGAGHEAEAAASLPPAHGFHAHNAPLGITFVRSEQAAPGLRGAALVALHGSWNRTRKDGYKVVSLHWGADGKIEERDFLTGFLRDDDVIGRPVDVAEGPDGAIYVSDDYAGAVFRVSRSDGAKASASADAPAAEAASAAAPDALAGLAPAAVAAGSERGRAHYDANAGAWCHAPARAPAGAPVPPLRQLASRYTVDSLTAFLAAPTPPMPVPPLDDAGRRDLAIYLLSRHP
jgi:glucose/arabinose dehydrogenase